MMSIQDLRDKVAERISEDGLIPENCVVILGLSGGPDSVCLLHLLASMRESLGIELVCAHVNHMLRAGESFEDEHFVRKLCLKLGVALETVRTDVALAAKKSGVSIEEAGRAVRYAFFDEIAERYDDGGRECPPVIALAHNADDNAETLLLRIVRGTGLGGLAGIPAHRKSEAGYTVARPLLGVMKDEILEALDSGRKAYRTDSTNAQSMYIRNKVRNELIPAIDKALESNIKKSLLRLAENAAEDKSYFDSVIDGILDEEAFRGLPEGKGSLSGRTSFPLELMDGMHPALRHRLVVRALAETGLDNDIASRHIKAIDGLIKRGETGKKTELPHGYEAGIEYGQVYFRHREDVIQERAAGVGESEVRLEEIGKNPKEVVFPIRACWKYTFRFSVIECGADLAAGGGEASVGFGSKKEIFLDYDRLAEECDALVIRTRKDGDRISPAGMNGTKKLQDLMVDMKIPRTERELIPLLAFGSEVLWIPGIRKSGKYSAGSHTGRIIRVSCGE
ncbi:MAG: tRNA lysidine(34) synthetase TilS [Clostridiales Family XIII bacterium]|jgi:tRNA(Ile)-lysidine synthase|nr:tRNA lysidine(34) synthetase TilS [Clostridiales Family XIII bacterium]